MIPPRPSVLELGEAEWYGDVPVQELSESIEALTDSGRRDRLHQRMVDLLAARPPTFRWDLVKLFYEVFLEPSRMLAIDFHGSAAAQDRSQPAGRAGRAVRLCLQRRNRRARFQRFPVFQDGARDHPPRRPDAAHHAFQGWVEQGFYSFNPGFFWDLASANDYAVALLAYVEIKPPKMIQLKSRETIIEMAQKEALGRNSLLYAA